jgi:2,3-bisphosphoglycerate-independent phosphoglycerate mutase
LKEGVLSNISPTILDLMGIPKPPEFDAESLLVR